MLERENNRHVLGNRASKMSFRSVIYRPRTITFMLMSVTTDSLEH